MSKSISNIKTFKYRLYPTHSQEQNLFRVLNCARSLYNIRRWLNVSNAYQIEGRRVSLADTEQLAKHYRATSPYARQMYSQTAQSVVKQVDNAYQCFFRRIKAGEKSRATRALKDGSAFRASASRSSATAPTRRARLKLSGVGRVAVRWHRPLEGDIKTVRIVHRAGCWYACFACEVESTPLPANGQSSASTWGFRRWQPYQCGVKVENPNYYRAAQKKLRVLQRRLARSKRGSNNRRKALLASSASRNTSPTSVRTT